MHVWQGTIILGDGAVTKAIGAQQVLWHQFSPGGRLNKKDGLTRYGDSHVKDKTS